MRTFAARLRNNGNKTSSLKRLIFILYKKQVPRNTIYREALISFEIRKVSGQAKRYKKLYTEEFDPGSG